MIGWTCAYEQSTAMESGLFLYFLRIFISFRYLLDYLPSSVLVTL